MRLKNTLRFGSYVFFIGEGDDTIRIPQTGSVSSRSKMVSNIMLMFNTLADQGEPGYRDKAVEEAEKMKVSYAAYIGLILEHQICVRAGGNPAICQGSGIGDTLHTFAGKVDNTIAKAPDFIKNPLQKLISSTLLRGESKDIRRTGRVSGCSGCGGTRQFTKAAWNFGRAGRLNRNR